MKIERITKRGRWHRGCRRILRYRIDAPRIEGYDRINALYLDIAERCERYCLGSLRDELRNMDEGEYLYELSYLCTHNDGETAALVMRARLSLSGRVLMEQLRTQFWSLSDEEMIPPRQAVKRFGGKINSVGKKRGVLLCDGEISELCAENCDALRQKKQI